MYKKQSITSRLAAMGDQGFVVPSFDHLRLDQAAAMLTEAEREANYVGMTARLEAGYNIEPLPADHSLTRISNVTLSAHSAFRTPEASENLIHAAWEHCRRIVKS